MYINEPLNDDDIIQLLEYDKHEHMNVQDTLKYLTDKDVLDVVHVEYNERTGCILCKYTDKLGMSRRGEHINHDVRKTTEIVARYYYIKGNELARDVAMSIIDS